MREYVSAEMLAERSRTTTVSASAGSGTIVCVCGCREERDARDRGDGQSASSADERAPRPAAERGVGQRDRAHACSACLPGRRLDALSGLPLNVALERRRRLGLRLRLAPGEVVRAAREPCPPLSSMRASRPGARRLSGAGRNSDWRAWRSARSSWSLSGPAAPPPWRAPGPGDQHPVGRETQDDRGAVEQPGEPARRDPVGRRRRDGRRAERRRGTGEVGAGDAAAPVSGGQVARSGRCGRSDAGSRGRTDFGMAAPPAAHKVPRPRDGQDRLGHVAEVPGALRRRRRERRQYADARGTCPDRRVVHDRAAGADRVPNCTAGGRRTRAPAEGLRPPTALRRGRTPRRDQRAHRVRLPLRVLRPAAERRVDRPGSLDAISTGRSPTECSPPTSSW